MDRTMYAPQNNGPHAELADAINAAQTSITVADASMLPTAPNVLTLGIDEDAELVLLESVTENILTVQRGYNETTAKSWGAGTWIYRAITAQDIAALQEHAKKGVRYDGMELTAEQQQTARENIGAGTATSVDGVEADDTGNVPLGALRKPAVSGDGILANPLWTYDETLDAYVLTIEDSRITDSNTVGTLLLNAFGREYVEKVAAAMITVVEQGNGYIKLASYADDAPSFDFHYRLEVYG